MWAARRLRNQLAKKATAPIGGTHAMAVSETTNNPEPGESRFHH
jgi:hypothetical protein